MSCQQGSVLAQLLFNLYTKYLPLTSLKKFIYANYIVLANQNNIFGNLKNSLTNDLNNLNSYFKQWTLNRTQQKQK